MKICGIAFGDEILKLRGLRAHPTKLAMTSAGLQFCARNDRRGFTLVELIMAMTVTGIILAAVATLAFALGSANDSADNTSEIQSRIRYTTIRFGELVRNCKLVCSNSGAEVAIWRADDKAVDNKINPGELVYIETGNSNGQIKLLQFAPTGAMAANWFTLAAISNGSAKTWLKNNCPYSYITLVNNCSYVTFTTDTAAPFSKRLNMFFGVTQKAVIQNYQCSAFLRAQAEYLLDSSGAIIASDDDM
ncbi:MAG: prepilin-type N-terminal cleavage/methylation domain-containing protein [Phycisphaerae bacterium]|jgi:prepilin-type N-terminal cleavage/methylation domain-containing protein